MRNKFFAALVVVSCCSQSVNAEIAVIVHPSNQQAISDTEVKNLFTGRQKSFADGSPAIVLNLVSGNETQTAFNTKVLGRSDAQLKAYWSKVMFTGKGNPPKEVDPAEMLKLVAENPSTVGVIDSSQVTSAVRTVISY
jgi:hypothetical protein